MTYYEIPGALLDVGCYMVNFYNEEKIKSLYEASYSKIQIEINQNYLQLKSIIGALPNHLHLFAYYDDYYYSVITAVIYNQPMETLTYEGFLDYLGSNSFTTTVYKHWLGKNTNISSVEDICKIDVLSLISSLKLPADIKYRLTLFFSQFDQYRDDLIGQFRRIYPIVTAYRKQNENIIDSCKIKFDNVFFSQHFISVYDTDISSFNYSLAFVNSLHYYIKRQKSYLMLGTLCGLQFGKDIDMKTFSSTFKKPEVVKMVEYLARSYSVSFSELVEYMGKDEAMVNHCLNDLMDESVIINKFSSDQLFISLNLEYFKNLPGIYNQAFSKLTGTKKEEA